MTMPSAARTTRRPAALLLDERPPTPSPAAPAELLDLDLEQQRIGIAVADLIARMDDPRLSGAALDRVAGRIAGLLVDAHEVRLRRAGWAADGAGDDTRSDDLLDPA